MNKLFIDFETYCDLDIKKVGAYKYINHSSFHPWCMAYAFDDKPIQLWKYPNSFPTHLLEAILFDIVSIYAHNAEFEWLILNKLGFKDTLKYTRFVDVMALAGTFGYPLSLDGFTKAVGLSSGKTAGSTRLLNKLCKRQKKTAFNTTGKWTPQTTPKDFTKLYDYCMNDVTIMRRAVKRLPQDKLSKFEQFVWGHTVKQNSRGVCIDVNAVKNIIIVMREFKKRSEQELQIATGGSVQTGKQIAKIKNFLWSIGVQIPDLTADTVNEYLATPHAGKFENMIDIKTVDQYIVTKAKELPEAARQVLELRRQLAHSSTAKFDRMIDMEIDNILYGMLKYFGAHTGRYAGTGVQLHNLPRASLGSEHEVNLVIAAFNSCIYDIIIVRHPDINATASKLIRSMIIAKPKHKLIVSDYVSIENVLLHWCADDKKTVQEFRDKKDQYKTFASARFKIPYDEVTKKQRQYAKPCILGLGYGGSVNALLRIATTHGVSMTYKQAESEVKFYRYKKYPKIPKFWYAIYNKAVEAIATGDAQILWNDNVKIEFRHENDYLKIKLPSGRTLWYPQAKLNYSWTIVVEGRPVQMTGKMSYMGVKNKQWMRVKTHPGFLVENIIQAMARDILVYGAMCAEQAGYPILFSVHDELISETKNDNTHNINEFNKLICIRQSWAESLPLHAAGYESQRYKKE